MSSYGRISDRDVELFRKTIQMVKAKVVSVLPLGVDREVRSLTLEMVLNTVFRDWWVNGNSDGLYDEDVEDLASFVRLAADLAGPSIDGEGKSVFKASLQALLGDWLRNWKPEEVGGSPNKG